MAAMNPAGLGAEGPTAKARELDNVRGGSMGIDDGSPQGRFVGLNGWGAGSR